MSNRINTVIFDFGCVLSLPPEPCHYKKLAELGGIKEALFNEIYWAHRAEYDRGTIDGPTYWRRIAKATGKEFTPARIETLIAQDTAFWMRTNPVMMSWVQTLKRSGLKIAILSNMPIEISRYMRQSAPWFMDFDHVCFSAEVQLAKPEAPIFRACLEAVHSRPEECLFIDDRAENVEGARAVGLHALHFVSAGELAAGLEPFNLPAPMAG